MSIKKKPTSDRSHASHSSLTEMCMSSLKWKAFCLFSQPESYLSSSRRNCGKNFWLSGDFLGQMKVIRRTCQVTTCLNVFSEEQQQQRRVLLVLRSTLGNTKLSYLQIGVDEQFRNSVQQGGPVCFRAYKLDKSIHSGPFQSLHVSPNLGFEGG